MIKRLLLKTGPLLKKLSKLNNRWGLIGVVFLLILIVYSLILPKTNFQQNKETLIKNPDNQEKLLYLAEELLNNNQFKDAETILLLIDQETNQQAKQLWQRKYYQDPKDIQRLIEAWQKIVEEKPNYRDAYLQLTNLYYRLNKKEKAREYLTVALKLDPNHQPSRDLEALLN